MKIYITSRGLYQVQNSDNYCLNCFDNLIQANSFVRSQGFAPIYTWIK